jgi:hypothetical protein
LSRPRSIHRKVLRPGIAAISALGFAAVLLGISPAQASIPTYDIGDTGPGGGVVFITPSTPGNSTGQYFEVRRSGVNLNGCIKIPIANFVDFGTDLNSPVAIGEGRANTADIARECRAQGASETLSLFIWVQTQTFGGFTDWFIPNRGEANRLIAERANPSVRALLDENLANSYLSNIRNNSYVAFIPGVYLFQVDALKTDSVNSLNGGELPGFVARMFSPATPPGRATLEDGQIALPPLEYVLGFNANGGSCSLSNSGQIIDGVWIRVPTAEQCSRPGFRLLGWNPKPDGSDPLGFDPGGWTLMTDDNTLFAIWVPSG